MYYVYCLQSLKRKDWLYVGSTADLKKRFNEHQKGKFIQLRYLPLRLIYYESYLVKKMLHRENMSLNIIVNKKLY